jgi:hypothetical protein
MTIPNIPSAEIEPAKLPKHCFIVGEAGRNSVRWGLGYTEAQLIVHGEGQWSEGYAKGRQSAALDALVADGQAVERLSDEQIHQLAKKHGTRDKYLDFARAIEAELRARSMEAETARGKKLLAQGIASHAKSWLGNAGGGVSCKTDGDRCSTYVECAATGCKRAAPSMTAEVGL